MSTLDTRVGTFVWHECLSTDVEAAKAFYTRLFGWELEIYKPGEMDYAMINVGGQSHGGFWQAPDGVPSHWLGHVRVENVDAAVARATGLGGTVLVGPSDIPEIGRFCVVADPEGAAVSLYQPDTLGPQPQGVFAWDELLTTDVEGAKRFYHEVLGWDSGELAGLTGTYTLLLKGEVQVAGAMPKPETMQAPPAWLVYVATPDVDATAKRAVELGGTVAMESTDIPDAGRIAVLVDPAGAAFGLFQMAGS
jgi:predicted enzyme related to lactoylglutathione lyase